MPQVFGGTEIHGHIVDFVTATLTQEDTWSEPWVCWGEVGTFAIVPLIIRLTGGPIVTVQTKRRGGVVWNDYGDTAGGVNGGILINTNGTIPLCGDWEVRAGIKTGALNGGSAIVEFGTRSST